MCCWEQIFAVCFKNIVVTLSFVHSAADRLKVYSWTGKRSNKIIITLRSHYKKNREPAPPML